MSGKVQVTEIGKTERRLRHRQGGIDQFRIGVIGRRRENPASLVDRPSEVGTGIAPEHHRADGDALRGGLAPGIGRHDKALRQRRDAGLRLDLQRRRGPRQRRQFGLLIQGEAAANDAVGAAAQP
ncbi:hypothetical protein D3C85_1572810 [compost metagenome]